MTVNLVDPEESITGKIIQYKVLNDNDIFILITGPTGVGKTSCAIGIGERFDFSGFTPKKAHMNVWDWIDYHNNKAKPGDVVFADELEVMVDKRKSNSNANVAFSWVNATMRKLNTIRLATAPVSSWLDKRTFHMVDMWIKVTKRGFALPHYINQIDHPIYGHWYPVRIRDLNGNAESMYFPDKSDTKVYKKLDEAKDNQDWKKGKNQEELLSEDELEREIKQAKMGVFETWGEYLWEEYPTLFIRYIDSLTQKEIGEPFGISQGSVSNKIEEITGSRPSELST